jgi:hypothetical protein
MSLPIDRLPGGFLKTTFLSGLILCVLIAGALITAAVKAGPVSSAPEQSFFSSLREYDRAALAAIDQQGTDTLNQTLDKLEKKAESLDSFLSILKRRRNLARINSRYIPAYRDAALRAAEAYPHSEPIAALAAAALIQRSAITGETELELRKMLPILSNHRFKPLLLSLHVLLGDFENSSKASAMIPSGRTGREDFASGLSLTQGLSASDREAVAADLALLTVLEGDASGAAVDIRSFLSGSANAPSNDFLRFAAEFFYDFGDPLRAAELFSQLPDDADLARQADALWLGGYEGSARNIWTILSSPGPEGDPETAPRSLYNLALSAADSNEAADLFRRLIMLPARQGAAQGGANAQGAQNELTRQDGPQSGPASAQARIFGLIRYSRFLPAPQAIAALESGGDPSSGAAFGEPLRELEMLRRRSETREAGRVVGETWMLLDRYPEAEELYRWGAWYFDYQRNTTETAMLLKTAARLNLEGPWIPIHEGLLRMREGDLNRAGEIFDSIPPENMNWTAAANSGRILEARRAPAQALEKYEIAMASLLKNREKAADRDLAEAARIQVRIAQCLRALGRAGDSRRALEYALDLNPENLNARLELSRLENR